jgi:hypothetical protein
VRAFLFALLASLAQRQPFFCPKGLGILSSKNSGTFKTYKPSYIRAHLFTRLSNTRLSLSKPGPTLTTALISALDCSLQHCYTKQTGPIFGIPCFPRNCNSQLEMAESLADSLQGLALSPSEPPPLQAHAVLTPAQHTPQHTPQRTLQQPPPPPPPQQQIDAAVSAHVAGAHEVLQVRACVMTYV